MPDASNVALPFDYPVIASTPPVPSTGRAQRCGLAGRCGRLQSGKPVLSYTAGKLVIIRNINTDESVFPESFGSKLPVLAYRGHSVSVTGVQISPSGAYCASGDERGKLKVWALDHEEHLAKFDGPVLSGPILDICWDGESKRIAVAGERTDAQSDAARVIQWDTGVSLGQLGQHVKGRVSGIAFKPERPLRIVTSGKEDYKLSFNSGPPFQKVVPNVEGVPCETAHEQKGSVNTVRYNHAGTLVASTGGDKKVCIYDGTTLELKGTLENVHKLTIFSLEWSDDDKTILTCSSDGKVKLLDVSEDGAKLSIKKEWDPPLAQNGGKAYDRLPVGGQQLGCTFVNGKTPVSVSLNGQLSVLPLNNGEAIKIVTGHSGAINDMAVDHKNGVFYTCDSDGLLCQWDWQTAQPKKRLEPANHSDLMYVIHGGAVSGVTALGDGSLLSVGWDDKMFVTDKAGKVGASPIALPAQPACVVSGNSLAIIVTVKGLLMVKGDALVGSLFQTSYSGLCACVSNDDKTVYVGGDDNKVYVYSCDGSSLTEKHVIADGHRSAVHALALSSDGSKLAAGDKKDVCVYDLKDGYNALIGKGRWCFHLQRITTLSWSPDDKVLASGGADDSIYLWSLEKKMKRKHYQYAHRGGLTALSFTQTAGEYKFVSVGMDAVVNQWDATADVQATFGF